MHRAPNRADGSRYTCGVLDRTDDLAALTVLDAQGTAVEVSSLWSAHTAILVFVRHFG